STIDESHPCEDCGHLISDALYATVDAVEANVVLAGSNYFTAWTDRIHATSTQKTGSDRSVTVAHLPFALGLTREDVLANVKAAGGTVVDAPGISSNCKVPDVVNGRLGAKLGHVPELEDLSLEVMVGHRTRASAIAELERKNALGPWTTLQA